MGRLKLTLSEKLTFCLSIVALIISVVAFYWQSIRSISEIAVTAVAPSIGPKSFSFEFAFFNTGNKAILIDSACVVTTTAQYPIGSCWGESNPEGLPAVLEPGKILKTKIERQSYSWTAMYETGLEASGPLKKSAGWKRIPIGLQLVIFDANGVRQETTTQPLFSFHVGPDGSTSNPITDYRSVTIVW